MVWANKKKCKQSYCKSIDLMRLNTNQDIKFIIFREYFHERIECKKMIVFERELKKKKTKEVNIRIKKK